MKPGIYLTEKEILELKTKLPPIKKILEKFNDPNFRIVAEEALEKAPDRWWLDPCSIRMSKDIPNRKFHNPITLTNPGGILDHSIVAILFALEALKLRPSFRLDIDTTLRQVPKPEYSDLASFTVLLHDLCKNGNPWGERTCPGHGKLAAEFIEKLSSFKKLKRHQRTLILNGIKWHMGNLSYDPTLIKDKFTEFEKVIQEADYWSTRKFLTHVDIDIPLINYPPKAHK